MTTTSAPPTTTAAASARKRARALTVLGAVIAAVVVWIVASPLAGADLTVRQGSRSPMEIGAVAVVVTALLAGLAGWGLLALLERLADRAATVWTVVAGVCLALSLLPPLTSEATTGAHVSLALMHLAVGGVLIAGLRRTAA